MPDRTIHGIRRTSLGSTKSEDLSDYHGSTPSSRIVLFIMRVIRDMLRSNDSCVREVDFSIWNIVGALSAVSKSIASMAPPVCSKSGLPIPNSFLFSHPCRNKLVLLYACPFWNVVW